MAAQLADEKGRGRAIGIVMSGLLVGVLGSRVISGFVGEQFGWRSMYYAATVLMILLFILLQLKLPKIVPEYKGSYGSLLKSIGFYFRTEPAVRLAALRGGLGFAGLSAFWTTLVFLMEDSFGYGSDVAGGFGLFGVIGAVTATVVGKMNDKVSKNKLILYAVLLMVVSWGIFFFSATSLMGLIAGVILVDLAFQALHITNQNIIFSKIQMPAIGSIRFIWWVFVGGALGTVLGAYAYDYFGWHGVAGLGIIFTVIIAIVHVIFRKKTV